VLAGLLKKKNKTLLGVDISSTSVKILELSLHNGRYQVENYTSEPLPANAVIEQSIGDEEAVGLVIKKALGRMRGGKKSGYCGCWFCGNYQKYRNE
jgi:type IV pilus assembly protein PilM